MFSHAKGIGLEAQDRGRESQSRHPSNSSGGEALEVVTSGTRNSQPGTRSSKLKTRDPKPKLRTASASRAAECLVFTHVQPILSNVRHELTNRETINEFSVQRSACTPRSHDWGAGGRLIRLPTLFLHPSLRSQSPSWQSQSSNSESACRRR